MPDEPVQLQLHQTLVEAGVRKSLRYALEVPAGHATSQEAKREIRQVAPPKHFHEREALISVLPELVVHSDHEADFLIPVIQSVTAQMLGGQSRGRRKVVNGIGGPDSQIVKAACDDDFLVFLVRACTEDEAEADNAVNVVTVPREVVPQPRLPGSENLLDCNELFFKRRKSPSLRQIA
jgi:hypothetical protein